MIKDTLLHCIHLCNDAGDSRPGRPPPFYRTRRSFTSLQISEGENAVSTEGDVGVARRALLEWSQRVTDRYPDLSLTDFRRSWADGRAFLCILHRYR